MPVVPEMVNARKIALVREYGVDPSAVSTDGFTDEYFTVIDANPTDAIGDSSVLVTARYEFSHQVKYRVHWRPADRQRAKDAIDGDFAASSDQVSPTVPKV